MMLLAKKCMVLACLCLFCTAGMFAQYGQRGERLEALRVAYLTRQLELTPDEAKRFWPVHDKYQTEVEKVTREHRQKNGDEIELEEKLLELRKRYKPDFVRATSEEKFNRFIRAEREFRDLIRKELDRRRTGGPPHRNTNLPR